MFGDYIAFVATVDTHTLSMGIKRIGREPLAPESRKNSKKKDCGKRRPPPFTSSTPRLPLPVRHHSAIVHTNNTPVFFPLRNTRTASVAWGGAPKALTLYREIWARRDAIFFAWARAPLLRGFFFIFQRRKWTTTMTTTLPPTRCPTIFPLPLPACSLRWQSLSIGNDWDGWFFYIFCGPISLEMVFGRRRRVQLTADEVVTNRQSSSRCAVNCPSPKQRTTLKTCWWYKKKEVPKKRGEKTKGKRRK